jgi:hypothetical protein
MAQVCKAGIKTHPQGQRRAGDSDGILDQGSWQRWLLCTLLTSESNPGFDNPHKYAIRGIATEDFL